MSTKKDDKTRTEKDWLNNLVEHHTPKIGNNTRMVRTKIDNKK